MKKKIKFEIFKKDDTVERNILDCQGYEFDFIHIDIRHNFIDFIDSRYYYEGEFHNKTILAPIRIDSNAIDFITIEKKSE